MVQSQRYYGVGLLPGLEVKKGLNDSYTFIGEAFSRLNYIDGNITGDNTKEWAYALTDVSAYLQRNSNTKWTKHFGYLIRFQRGEIRHRFIEGANYSKSFEKWKLGQRFRLDQTIGSKIKPIYRGRYKISGGFPLKIKGDVEHWKLNIGNEYLGIVQSDNLSLEIRLTADIDHYFNNNNKIQFGLDYRLSDVFENNITVHNFWITGKYTWNLD